MSGTHSVFSASGSKRWLNCSGSIRLSRGIPDAPDSKWAAEGTRAHEVLDKLIAGHLKGQRLATEASLRNQYPLQMIVHASNSLDTLIADTQGDTLVGEQKVSLEFIGDGLFGTLDVMAYTPFRTLKVYDYKYGAGVPVDVENNSQLIYYALGVAHLHHYNFADVELTIIQPRAYHRQGPIRKWKAPIEMLDEWSEIFSNGVKAALRPNAKLVPGDWCRWCKAGDAGLCPAVQVREPSNWYANKAASEFADLD